MLLQTDVSEHRNGNQAELQLDMFEVISFESNQFKRKKLVIRSGECILDIQEQLRQRAQMLSIQHASMNDQHD